MAMNNFIPELWADMLMVDRAKETVFAKLCYTDFIGEIKNKGDRVHFTGIGRPTIQTYTKGITLTTEYLNDYGTELIVDKANYFNVLLDDIDDLQANGKVMPTTMSEARKAMAEKMDEDIATLYDQACTQVTKTELTSVTTISTISDGVVALLDNNVPSNEEIDLVVSPAIAMKILMADIVFNTDNSKSIAGYVGQLKSFINCTIYTSNSVVKNGNAYECMMFTRKAIALAEQIPVGSIEKYRPQTSFADAIKGLHLYGRKVLKPKELVRLTLTPKAETTV